MVQKTALSTQQFTNLQKYVFEVWTMALSIEQFSKLQKCVNELYILICVTS